MTVLLAFAGLAAILYLSSNVMRDLRLLSSARSDNVQWTLSQTEVDFLDFQRLLDRAMADPAPDLSQLRREFDLFYSRIETLRNGSIYEAVRKTPAFSESLAELRSFLDAAVPLIDAPDADLQAALPALAALAADLRPTVRSLSNSGLSYFAEESDRRRLSVSVTLVQLAAGLSLLVSALVVMVLYLRHLHRQDARRIREVMQAGARMNVVIGTALDAVIVSDSDGRVLNFNAAAEQIFGYRADQAIGNLLTDLIVPEGDRAAHQAGLRRFAGSGLIQMEARRANGEVFPAEFAIQSAMTDEGEICIAFLRDISQRVAAKNELVEARDRALANERSKSDFIATMSHEIRTPLNGLLGNLALLRDTEPSAEQARLIGNMEISGRLLMNHVSDVLDITKYDAGKLQLRPVTMHVGALLEDIVSSQSGAAIARNTRLRWLWAGRRCDWVVIDRDRLQHVLMNIVGNAVKFTRDGVVTIEAALEPKDGAVAQLRFGVRDTGIGMDPDLIARIFDDFTTGDVSYGREVGGTGLGLGIARRFVRALGGRIDVESAPGEGSLFTVTVPVQEAAPPELEQETGPVPGLVPPRHVLLVEDNEINRFVAREMLAAQGHRVSEAVNGRAAVERAAQGGLDLILMDISMPVMDGRAATRAIRALPGDAGQVPIVALTASAMPDEQAAFLSDGMAGVLTKPLSRDGLARVLARHARPGFVASGPQGAEAAAGGGPEKLPGEAAADLPLVDGDLLAGLARSIGPESLSALVARLHEEVEGLLTLLESAGQASMETIAFQVHRVSGSAAVLGAPRLHAALRAVERAARARDRADMPGLARSVAPVWAATRPEFSPARFAPSASEPRAESRPIP